MNTIKRLLCLIRPHKLRGVCALSEQAMLVECERCGKRYAMKMEGGCQGMMLQWDKEVQDFYRDVFDTPKPFTDEQKRAYMQRSMRETRKK